MSILVQSFVFKSVGLSQENDCNALSISDDNEFQVHLKELPNSSFVHNYFRTDLSACEANSDIQPFCNHYKTITYMFMYLLKTGWVLRCNESDI